MDEGEKLNERSPKELQMVLQNSIFSKVLGEKEQKISYLTVVKYLKIWGFKQSKWESSCIWTVMKGRMW